MFRVKKHEIAPFIFKEPSFYLKPERHQMTMLSTFEIFGRAKNSVKSSWNSVRPPSVVSSIVASQGGYVFQILSHNMLKSTFLPRNRSTCLATCDWHHVEGYIITWLLYTCLHAVMHAFLVYLPLHYLPTFAVYYKKIYFLKNYILLNFEHEMSLWSLWRFWQLHLLAARCSMQRLTFYMDAMIVTLFLCSKYVRI